MDNPVLHTICTSRKRIKAVVLNLGSIEPKGFVKSVSGVRQKSRILRPFSTIQFKFMFCWFCSLNTVGARCSSSVVRAFAHGAMGRRIDPSWWTH